MILVRRSYLAWCRHCDSPASPAHRETRQEAQADLTAHMSIQHPDLLLAEPAHQG